jgi:hypothetical protein
LKRTKRERERERERREKRGRGREGKALSESRGAACLCPGAVTLGITTRSITALGPIKLYVTKLCMTTLSITMQNFMLIAVLPNVIYCVFLQLGLVY